MPFASVGINDNPDLQAKPLSLHLVKNRFKVRDFRSALKWLNTMGEHLSDSEEKFPHFISPTFIDDINLQPLNDQEFKLWTRDPNQAPLLRVTVVPDNGQTKEYAVRSDITLGDFKRLLLKFRPEPFIVNHMCKNTDKLGDVVSRRENKLSI